MQHREDHRPTLDDLVFINKRELALRDPVGASDHCSASLLLDFNSKPAAVGGNARRNYNNANYETMRQAVNLNWLTLFTE